MYGIGFVLAAVVAGIFLFLILCMCKVVKIDVDIEVVVRSMVATTLVFLVSFCLINMALIDLDSSSMDNDNITKHRTVYTKNIVAINDNDKEKKYFERLEDSVQVILDDGGSKEIKNLPISYVYIIEDGKTELKYVREYRTGWIAKLIGEESVYADSYYELHIPKGMNY